MSAVHLDNGAAFRRPSRPREYSIFAPSDGEYSFTFVTIDRRGNQQPRVVETAPPHRIVVVDSIPPTVTARLVSTTGERLLQCRVNDANPDPATLRAFYLSPSKRWLPLAAASAGSPMQFKVPTQAIVENKVRITTADRAGNHAQQDISLANSPALPAAAEERTPSENGRPDPTLLTKDMDPVVSPPPPAIPDPHRLGDPDIPKAPKFEMPPVPAMPDSLPIRAPELPPEMKQPGAADVKIPDPKPAENLKLPEAPYVAPPAIKPPVDLPPPPVVPAARRTSEVLKPNDLPPIAEPKHEVHSKEKSAGSHPVFNTRKCVLNYEAVGGAQAR